MAFCDGCGYDIHWESLHERPEGVMCGPCARDGARGGGRGREGEVGEARAALERITDWDCVRDYNGADVRLLRGVLAEVERLRAIEAAALAYGAAHAAEQAAREALALAPYRQETVERLNAAWLATWEPMREAHDALCAAYAAHAGAGA